MAILHAHKRPIRPTPRTHHRVTVSVTVDEWRAATSPKVDENNFDHATDPGAFNNIIARVLNDINNYRAAPTILPFRKPSVATRVYANRPLRPL